MLGVEATLHLRCQSNRTVKYLFLLGNEAADEAPRGHAQPYTALFLVPASGFGLNAKSDSTLCL